MEYHWKDQDYSVPAQMVGEIIETIEQKEGVCHPEKLVEKARPVSSLLHSLFEWDDTEAAERYRIYQARQVINSIRVVFEEGQVPLPAFVHVRLEGAGPGYMRIVRAMSDEALRLSVLQGLLKTLQALRERYEALEEFRPVWEAIEKVKVPRRRRALVAARR